MPLAKNIMSGGISAGQASAIAGRVISATVTAAGTTQGGAATLAGDVNLVTTATTGQGVIIYAGPPGDSQIVYNATTTDIRVYPPTGVAINQLSANAAFTLAPRTAVWVFLLSSTAAVGFMSA